MKHTILHKTVKRKAGAPPCHLDDYYSVDGGETWMSRKRFYKWKAEQIDIVPLHLYNSELTEAISTSGRKELIETINMLNKQVEELYNWIENAAKPL